VREESYGSVRVFSLDTEHVRGVLQERARDLVASGRAEKVVLFGSLAEGRAVPGSDADILVIANNATGREMVDEIPAHFAEIGIPVDIFVFPEEDPENPFIRTALERGIVLASRSS
jgi:predicted nucleotidyltransferase